MPSEENQRKELRCFCSRSPLLAVYGIDLTGKLFIHVRVYKQNRIFGELIFRGGEVSIKCRECYRWYNIFIRNTLPKLIETVQPVELRITNDVVAGTKTSDGVG